MLPNGKAITPAQRASILRKAGDLLEQRTPDLMALAIREAGKSCQMRLLKREAVVSYVIMPRRLKQTGLVGLWDQ